ncbi:hypothetical protein [Caldanaerobius polysaccharolyticus]|uniref:hypothetical protein n=1 Tax=Caldanaerobius polysaccharolyticus TaxID=44256 RepID=UPI001C54C269|nr:hypothetical protein [Caldanaerobius polysaccharolyticus]
MDFKIEGLDKLQKKFEQIQKAAKELEKTKTVSFNELFTSSFMNKYTNFSTIDEFFEAGKFVINSQEDFEAIPDKELDAHVKNSTVFSSWNDMLSKATEIYISKNLGF